ncbi:MAG: hypothetical protein PHW02_04365 [bacterium]|nr:hypothetical protein [bacterium]
MDEKEKNYRMTCIKSKNTSIEMRLRKILWKNGYRYRLNVNNLPGHPDIVFPSKRKIIFINGCFWHCHRCSSFKWPKKRKEFWENRKNRRGRCMTFDI